MKVLKYISDFLTLNGFYQVNDDLFVNDNCEVEIKKSFDTEYYAVKYKIPIYGEGTMFSNDLNIYWLIGVLTYYNLIEKNYKI